MLACIQSLRPGLLDATSACIPIVAQEIPFAQTLSIKTMPQALHVEWQEIDISEVRVMNASGQLLHAQNLLGKREFDWKHQGMSGLHFLLFETDAGMICRKVLILP
jgi:hypothetical protein